jgi:hypothetical protein
MSTRYPATERIRNFLLELGGAQRVSVVEAGSYLVNQTGGPVDAETIPGKRSLSPFSLRSSAVIYSYL